MRHFDANSTNVTEVRTNGKTKLYTLGIKLGGGGRGRGRLADVNQIVQFQKKDREVDVKILYNLRRKKKTVVCVCEGRRGIGGC